MPLSDFPAASQSDMIVTFIGGQAMALSSVSHVAVISALYIVVLFVI